MRTIWKVDLEIGYTRVVLPEGAKPLTVMVQDDRPRLWLEVETLTMRHEARHFDIFGTGHPLDDDGVELEYIGSFLLAADQFVGHLYERVVRED
jgi:hypothetical protein